MMPLGLFPQEQVYGSGTGPYLDLGEARGKPLSLTLTITRMMERHTLDISIWGSKDNVDWGRRPLSRLPHRYYCGTYCTEVDLSADPEVRYLRVEYNLGGWWRGNEAPALATFFMTAEPVCEEAMVTAVAGSY